MARNKTMLRLVIEDFLADNDEHSDDWLSLQCNSSRETKKMRSMAYSMKQSGYNIEHFEFDKATKVFWIKKLKPENEVVG